METNLAFVMGPAGAGKSTFLQTVLKSDPERIGLVEVGKTLRAMYPLDYFKGQAAPAHTEALAMKLCHDGIEAHRTNGKKLILIDGQPRKVSQCEKIFEYVYAPGFNTHFVNLFAPIPVREERLREREKDNPAALDLALSRVTGDLLVLYEVLSMISDECHTRLVTFNTTNPRYDPVAAIHAILMTSSFLATKGKPYVIDPASSRDEA